MVLLLHFGLWFVVLGVGALSFAMRSRESIPEKCHTAYARETGPRVKLPLGTLLHASRLTSRDEINTVSSDGNVALPFPF